VFADDVRPADEALMNSAQILDRYRELQAYVGWGPGDEDRVKRLRPLVEPSLEAIVVDFYEEIDRHEGTRAVMTGGPEQRQRLHGTLLTWLRSLLAGPYDQDFVARRWRVGHRHAELGLQQVFTNVALSRIRGGLIRSVHLNWTEADGDLEERDRALLALMRLLDLDLALIEDAYQAESTARLKANERLATLGQVAGGLAHELRNPLNVMKTSAFYLLRARNLTDEKRVEHLERIERQVTIADSVITALSNFARMPTPLMVPLEVERIFRESLEQGGLGPGISVEMDLPDDLPRALADLAQMRIVISNLIRNARDAMPGGGVITLSARALEGGGVELEVADTGVGIPADELHRITEPLFSTKARGLGLGLAITRSIVDKHQGGLNVRSEPGQGTTFTVRLLSEPVLTV
jgi:signal transduction histidine kinase